MIKGSSYLKKPLGKELPKIIKTIEKKLKTFGVDNFDAIAFSGMSGALVAPIIANSLGKGLIMVRKKEVATHSYHIVEGDTDHKRYIILDDLISSGRTMNYIIEKTDEFLRSEENWDNQKSVGFYKPVAIVLYNHRGEGDSLITSRKGYKGFKTIISG